MMAVVFCTRFPQQTLGFLAYQTTIIRAERNYEGTQWVSYGRRYRRVALVRKDLNRLVPDAHLYNEAFTQLSSAARIVCKTTMSRRP